MEGTDRPEWHAITYIIFVILIVFLLSLINTGINHRRPNKEYIDRKHKPAETTGKKEAKTKKNDIKQEQKSHTPSVDEPKNVVKEKPIKEQRFVSIPDDLSDSEYFKKLIENYQATTMSKLQRPESRKDVVLRYYTKEKDDGKVYKLRKYGFYIHERPSESSFADYGTNTLYYGDDVSNNDIQLVAYLLTQNGIELKKITPSKLHDDWKSNALELGTDTLVNDLPPLKLSDIRKTWN